MINLKNFFCDLYGDRKDKVSSSFESYLKKEFPYPFRPTGDVSGHIGQLGDRQEMSGGSPGTRDDHQEMSGCRKG